MSNILKKIIGGLFIAFMIFGLNLSNPVITPAATKTLESGKSYYVWDYQPVSYSGKIVASYDESTGTDTNGLFVIYGYKYSTNERVEIARYSMAVPSHNNGSNTWSQSFTGVIDTTVYKSIITTFSGASGTEATMDYENAPTKAITVGTAQSISKSGDYQQPGSFSETLDLTDVTKISFTIKGYNATYGKIKSVVLVTPDDTITLSGEYTSSSTKTITKSLTAAQRGSCKLTMDYVVGGSNPAIQISAITAYKLNKTAPKNPSINGNLPVH